MSDGERLAILICVVAMAFSSGVLWGMWIGRSIYRRVD